MYNLKPIQLGDQLFRPRMKIPQRGILNFVNALDVPNQQLRVTDQFQRLMSVLNRVLEGSYESLILGNVIGLMAEILAQGRDSPSDLVVNDAPLPGRAWGGAPPACGRGKISECRAGGRTSRSPPQSRTPRSQRASHHPAAVPRSQDSPDSATRP